MPVHAWRNSDGTYSAQWGSHGHIYKSKDRETARKKADAQGQAAHANGYRGNEGKADAEMGPAGQAYEKSGLQDADNDQDNEEKMKGEGYADAEIGAKGGGKREVPDKVKEIADAIRKQHPDVSDEYAYRIAYAQYEGTISHAGKGKADAKMSKMRTKGQKYSGAW